VPSSGIVHQDGEPVFLIRFDTVFAGKVRVIEAPPVALHPGQPDPLWPKWSGCKFEGLRPRRPVRPDSRWLGWGKSWPGISRTGSSGPAVDCWRGALRISTITPRRWPQGRTGRVTPLPSPSPGTRPSRPATQGLPVAPPGATRLSAQARPARLLGCSTTAAAAIPATPAPEVPPGTLRRWCLELARTTTSVHEARPPQASSQPFAGQDRSSGPAPAPGPPGRGADQAHGPHRLAKQATVDSAAELLDQARCCLSSSGSSGATFWTSARMVRPIGLAPIGWRIPAEVGGQSIVRVGPNMVFDWCARPCGRMVPCKQSPHPAACSPPWRVLTVVGSDRLATEAPTSALAGVFMAFFTAAGRSGPEVLETAARDPSDQTA